MIRNLCLLMTFTCLILAKADDKQLGKLGKYRLCYDVKHYEIKVDVHPLSRSIGGQNAISFRMSQASSLIQLDFVAAMKVLAVQTMDGAALKHIRKGRALMVELPRVYNAGEGMKLCVKFEGRPEVAKKAPWQGGFVWSKDARGNDWVGLACESKGASIWLPCKDHWSDEPDSIDMYLGVPRGLVGVSNGRLMGNVSVSDSFTVYHWKTLSPINHYDITINIGKYAHIEDSYPGLDGPLKKDYYVLFYNASKAISHFRETDTMLQVFEHYFGPYPFYIDGYKLVEAPYWGMEHQSCVAYGNNYRYNRYKFDFILVHESGHEWFANSITASDPADMWIHESFTTYSESLYVEYTQGIDSAISYLNMQRKLIKSKTPIQGQRDINFHDRKDNDIYYKGTWMLHTLRTVFGNDSLWFAALRNLSRTFRHKITNTEEVTAFLNKELGHDYGNFWRQYLYDKRIPLLHIRRYVAGGVEKLEYYFTDVVKGFELELRLRNGKKLLVRQTKQTTEFTNALTSGDIDELQNRYLIRVKTER